MVELGLKMTLAYCLGSVMGALVIGALRGGIDIRKMGSGNAGGTNALRTQGRAFAAGVMLIDAGKGILAAAVIPRLDLPFVGTDPLVDRDLLLHAVALAAIGGHVFPLWFGFRGGKGGATAAGLLCYLAPDLALPILGLWLAIVFFSGYVGLATISATLAAAGWLGLVEWPERKALFVFACLVAVLTFYTHRGNIRRMWLGNESRFARYFGLGSR
jgi:acyl phosphate:glycerol-3-phosphate acyltransferase